jgi:flavorubredoxin/flavin reductase (DIM6/NTAB) family NADH-FMN oxidoreductase RutF
VCVARTGSASPLFHTRTALKRGTSDNCYLVTGTDSVCALVDLPDTAFVADWVAGHKGALKGAQSAAFLVLTTLSPRQGDALAALLAARPASAGTLEVWCSNPAAQTLRLLLADGPGRNAGLAAAWRGPAGLRARLRTVRGGDVLRLGAKELAFTPVPTPRWPDAVVVHDRTAGVLFTGQLFSAHVACAEAFDEGGMDAYGEDWRYFFECMLAPVAKQLQTALDRLDITVAPAPVESAPPAQLPGSRAGGVLARLLQAVQSKLPFLGKRAQPPSDAPHTAAPSAPGTGLAVHTLAPLHGPVVRRAASELVSRYGAWSAAQLSAVDAASVACIYASAYGNTGALAAALCRGVTKAGAAAVSLNAEFATQEEVAALVASCDGFLIGSPTLGGHMPTPVKQALGTILQEEGSRAKLCGVFGSFGWSGEAVDELEAKLRDGGFTFGFPPIRCKFTPTEAVLQTCEEAGTDVAQAVLRKRKQKAAAAARDAASATAASSGSGGVQALGRLVGSLCVLTARQGDAVSGMVASWVSQASFSPPAITVAVAKDRAVESLVLKGSAFCLNILAAGAEKAAMRALLKPFEPGADRFGELETRPGERSGAPVLLGSAASYLECTVTDRLDAGDHWVLLATVEDGQLLKEDALTAVHFRKTGASY